MIPHPPMNTRSQVRVKLGFHYPSTWIMETGHPSTQVVETGLYGSEVECPV